MIGFGIDGHQSGSSAVSLYRPAFNEKETSCSNRNEPSVPGPFPISTKISPPWNLNLDEAPALRQRMVRVQELLKEMDLLI